MDAHTLNAWTRFALQKGGIGSCIALIDNPATDLEDLMFMAGEKIIVLRRLDEDGPESTSERRNLNGDADQWFLGYCEGVVGRFKGAHVQFQGKLKKPVLMRRSGVGAIRESTLRPMSKSEAAALHASQVPPGIPVTAVDSDDEDASAEGARSAKSTDGSVRESVFVGGASGASDRQAGPRDKSFARHLADSATPISSIGRLGGKLTRLGVTTPPLSDETHIRGSAAARTGRIDHDDESDSDDESDTHLPWARASTSSNKSLGSTQDHVQRTGNSMSDQAAALLRGGRATDRSNDSNSMHHHTHTLPPSPISSAESPLNSRPGENAGLPPSGSYEGVIPRIRAPGLGHTPNQSSIETMTTTSESEEDARRRDHALSIYEVYGRDSVAFPNFDFRALNGNSGSKTNSHGGGARVTTSTSSDSLDMTHGASLSASAQNGKGVGGSVEGRAVPVALRTPSSRRPTAAPPVAGAALGSKAASLRRKATETSSDAGSVGSSAAAGSGNAGSFGNFDPRRRPSMGNLNGVRHPPARNQSFSSSEARLSSGGTIDGGDGAPVPPIPAVASHKLADEQPIGSNLRARRMQDPNTAMGANAADPNMRVDVNGGMDAPNRPFAAAAAGALPSPSAMTYRPARSSSDRTSHRERIGSGQLRKNPSNPQPGLHGGMSALMIPSTSQAGGGSMSSPSRSPSPLSAHSPVGSMGRPLSPAGPMSASPSGASSMQQHQMPSLVSSGRPSPSPTPSSMQARMQQPSPVQHQSVSPSNVSFDAMGFVKGAAPPIALPREDPEEVKAWRQLLSENDVAAAKKSRKVKKMVQSGIPHSMRATVWPFLASAYVRRRPGLFEELCKVSQSAKGKKGKETQYEAIEKDVDRAYPDHKIFMGGERTGVSDLEAILKAYLHYNPIVGYTQGMNLVAGFLLIQMPAEDAFWLLCALMRDVHMEGYYTGDMKQLHVDGIVFGQLLQSMDSALAERLIELGIEPINFAANWLLPIFARILPWQTLLRAWDMFFFEGPSWILRVALAIIRILRDPLMDRRACPGTGEALRLLLHPPQNLLTPDNVIPCALSVKLKDGEMRKLSRQASKLVRNTVLNPSGRGRPQSNGGASVARSASVPATKRQPS